MFIDDDLTIIAYKSESKKSNVDNDNQIQLSEGPNSGKKLISSSEYSYLSNFWIIDKLF